MLSIPNSKKVKILKHIIFEKGFLDLAHSTFPFFTVSVIIGKLVTKSTLLRHLETLAIIDLVALSKWVFLLPKQIVFVEYINVIFLVFIWFL